MTAIPKAIVAGAPEGGRSPWGMAGRRFLRNRLAVAGLVLLAALMAACFGAIPWTLARSVPTGPGGAAAHNSQTVARYEDQMGLQHIQEPPSGDFWMGTDTLGRDLRARFFLGGAISLSIGLASAAIAVLIGSTVGLVAGYAGGRVDAALMRLVDVLYGLPYILLVILMRVTLVPPMQQMLAFWVGMKGDTAGMWANLLVLLVGIGGVSWLTMARVVRGQVMSLRDQPFVEAARALGLGGRRILARHILPNLVGTIVAYGTLAVPAAILSESFLSFLGLGIQDPLPSWGKLASDGMAALNPVHVRWWLITWPCVGLSLALLCLNFVGDGLRDALDPKSS